MKALLTTLALLAAAQTHAQTVKPGLMVWAWAWMAVSAASVINNRFIKGLQ